MTTDDAVQKIEAEEWEISRGAFGGLYVKRKNAGMIASVIVDDVISARSIAEFIASAPATHRERDRLRESNRLLTIELAKASNELRAALEAAKGKG